MYLQFDDQRSWRIYCGNGHNPAEESNSGQYRSGEIYIGACEVKGAVLYLKEVFDEPNLDSISENSPGWDLGRPHFKRLFPQTCP